METFFPLLPSGRVELLWVSSGLLYSALNFPLLGCGVQSEGTGVTSHSRVTSFLLISIPDLKLRLMID